jgi:pyruvate/2-oxoglutarate dehydrogenase complex dihydrolipoamide dehydrogenase (E3) component
VIAVLRMSIFWSLDFALFGTQLTLLQGPDRLLPREDSDVAAEVADILANQKSRLTTGHPGPGCPP